MAEKAAAVAGTPAVTGDGSQIVVVDIGKKQSKKAIKRLRQGRGKLMPKIESAIQEIQEETKTTNVMPVVVVVEKKQRRRWIW
jgi:hypothetical protein